MIPNSEEPSFWSLAPAMIGCFVVVSGWLAAEKLSNGLSRSPAVRRALYAAPLVSLSLLCAALPLWTARELHTSGYYCALFLVVGICWLGVGTELVHWLGISLRDDAAERRNPAAAAAWAGMLWAVTCAYVGGSSGEGPSFADNLFCAGLATAGLAVGGLVLQGCTGVAAVVTVERDTAAGVRVGGFYLALGLLLGRAVAGDWHSAAETVHDLLRDGWPVAPLLVVAIAVERRLRPTPRQAALRWQRAGLLPATAYVAAAALWLWRLGSWDAPR